VARIPFQDLPAIKTTPCKTQCPVDCPIRSQNQTLIASHFLLQPVGRNLLRTYSAQFRRHAYSFSFVLFLRTQRGRIVGPRCEDDEHRVFVGSSAKAVEGKRARKKSPRNPVRIPRPYQFSAFFCSKSQSNCDRADLFLPSFGCAFIFFAIAAVTFTLAVPRSGTFTLSKTRVPAILLQIISRGGASHARRVFQISLLSFSSTAKSHLRECDGQPPSRAAPTVPPSNRHCHQLRAVIDFHKSPCGPVFSAKVCASARLAQSPPAFPSMAHSRSAICCKRSAAAASANCPSPSLQLGATILTVVKSLTPRQRPHPSA